MKRVRFTAVFVAALSLAVMSHPVCAALTALPAAGASSPLPSLAPMVKRISPAVVNIIVDAGNGYIITNHHVIENADEITVTLLDDRSFSAKVIGIDKAADLALLQAKQPDLVALTLGDSAGLEVGDFVVAIGNPCGLQHTAAAPGWPASLKGRPPSRPASNGATSSCPSTE